jgi:hypothetical protein
MRGGLGAADEISGAAADDELQGGDRLQQPASNHPLGLSDDARQGLMAAGFALLGGKSNNFFHNLGGAGLAGMTAYQGARKLSDAARRTQAIIDRDERRDRLMDQRYKDQWQRDTDRYEIEKQRLEQGNWETIPGVGKDAEGNEVPGLYRFNKKTGAPPQFVPGQFTQKGAGAVAERPFKMRTEISPLSGEKIDIMGIRQPDGSILEIKPGMQIGPGGRPVSQGPNENIDVSAAGARSPEREAGIDSTLFGDEYLNQFPPETQAAVRARVRGEAMPAGASKRKQFVDGVARKYAEDMGTVIDDTVYSQRRAYRQQLGSNSPSSVGGQRNLLGTTFEHLEKVADYAEALGNYDLYSKRISHGVNALRGETTEQAGKVNRLMDAVDKLAGETGRLYSGTQGGGVSERKDTKNRFSGNLSGPELAGALEASKELIIGRMRALEHQRNEILGPMGGNVNFVSKEMEDRLTRIDKTIARLRGEEKAEKKPTTPPQNAPEGVSKSALPPPDQREVGKYYTNSKGVSKKWTGNGWVD